MLSRLEDQLAIFERRLFELESQLAEQNLQLEDVAKMGLIITSLLDLERVLAAMMEMAIRTANGEVGCIMLEEGDGLVTKVSWGADRETLRSIRLDEDVDVVDWVMKTGESAIINDIQETNTRKVKINSLIVAPLILRDLPIGVLVIINKTGDGRFSEDDKVRVQMLVRFAAVAIENANLLKSKLRAQKIEQELELARTVQQALLPPSSATFEKALIDAVYVPAGHVGGDYFDIIKIRGNEFVVIVGDVSNKGVPAALMMSAIRSVFRMEAGKGTPIDKMLTNLNSFLCEQVLNTRNMFISLSYCYFNLNEMTCTYVNARHLPPLHYSRCNKSVTEWRVGGTVLGQITEMEFRSETVKLESGDKVLIYTDGVSESENLHGELFGRKRVQEFVAKNASLLPRQLTQKLLDEVEAFRSNDAGAQIDDTTALVVEIK